MQKSCDRSLFKQIMIPLTMTILLLSDLNFHIKIWKFRSLRSKIVMVKGIVSEKMYFVKRDDAALTVTIIEYIILFDSSSSLPFIIL